ncbi:exocyst complex component 3-like [Dysidea avara]|uniref:exocyst complex component 3-like n=1 Tax=Dysidea avara TaxID=196820 RepID=UPI00331737E4
MDSEATDSTEQASKEIAKKLTKPEHLDQVDQLIRQYSRQKASIESRLRNAVQTQLDGVQKGLADLRKAVGVVKEIKESMSEVEELYKNCKDLEDSINPIREVNRRYQQLSTTHIHINNIFNVPQTVLVTHELIQHDRLLQAHKNLSELEMTRDDLLIQLYQSSEAFVDKNTSLHHYFEELIGLSDALGQQLWVTLHKTLSLVCNDPTKVVTALRIIEREEREDKRIENRVSKAQVPISQLPGRPKRWQMKCLDILESSISNRFQKHFPRDRNDDAAWLGEYLITVEKFVYEDLSVVQKYAMPCFPPAYQINQFYITRYHENLQKLAKDLIDRNLTARDIIFLRLWVRELREQLLELGFDLDNYGPLIQPNSEKDLEVTCLDQVRSSVQEYITRMLNTEKEDWCSSKPPESDINGHYHTGIALVLFQMVDQNISAMASLGTDTKLKVLQICLDALQEFQTSYKALVEAYNKESISEAQYFIFYMVSITNNCNACVEFVHDLRDRFRQELNEIILEENLEKSFKQIHHGFDEISSMSINFLLDIVFGNLTPVLDSLLNRQKWLQSPGNIMETVAATFQDYNGEFHHLKQKHHSALMIEAQQRLVMYYIDSLMRKRIVFKNEKERQKGGEQIKKDAKHISSFFARLSHATNPKKPKILEELAELISVKIEFLPLEISGLASKQSDITADHIIALLAMRDDMSKSKVKQLMSQTTLAAEEDGGKQVEPPASSSKAAATAAKYAASPRSDQKPGYFTTISVNNPLQLH